MALQYESLMEERCSPIYPLQKRVRSDTDLSEEQRSGVVLSFKCGNACQRQRFINSIFSHPARNCQYPEIQSCRAPLISNLSPSCYLSLSSSFLPLTHFLPFSLPLYSPSSIHVHLSHSVVLPTSLLCSVSHIVVSRRSRFILSCTNVEPLSIHKGTDSSRLLRETSCLSADGGRSLSHICGSLMQRCTWTGASKVGKNKKSMPFLKGLFQFSQQPGSCWNICEPLWENMTNLIIITQKTNRKMIMIFYNDIIMYFQQYLVYAVCNNSDRWCLCLKLWT